MSTRAIAVVAVLSVFAPKMPEQCNKMMGKGGTPSASAEPPPPPPPPPPPSATTPPIWAPPDTGGTATAAPPHKPSASELDTQAAKAAMEKKKYKDARTILEKKIKTNTATPEDITILKDACEKLKDMKCLAAVAKAETN